MWQAFPVRTDIGQQKCTKTPGKKFSPGRHRDIRRLYVLHISPRPFQAGRPLAHAHPSIYDFTI